MKLICYKNGEATSLQDPLDLDYIEYDVIKDYLKDLWDIEQNPQARVEIDFTESFAPKYNLVNCGLDFKQKFNQVINRKKFA